MDLTKRKRRVVNTAWCEAVKRYNTACAQDFAIPKCNTPGHAACMALASKIEQARSMYAGNPVLMELTIKRAVNDVVQARRNTRCDGESEPVNSCMKGKRRAVAAPLPREKLDPKTARQYNMQVMREKRRQGKLPPRVVREYDDDYLIFQTPEAVRRRHRFHNPSPSPARPSSPLAEPRNPVEAWRGNKERISPNTYWTFPYESPPPISPSEEDELFSS
jgi:hypothetical protein